MKLSTSILGWILMAAAVAHSFAFQLAAPTSSTSQGRQSLPMLFAKKKKKSVLGEVVASGGVVPKTKSIKRTVAPKKSAGASISPALAEWASSEDGTTSTNTIATTVEDTVESANMYTPFEQESKKNTRRVKQSARKQEDEQRDAQVNAILENVNVVLEETKNSLEDILNAIRPILSLSSGNLRLLTAGKVYNYRLAWVGSDDALCHVGTGLHKVPLARMQEVFLTCQGKGRLEIYEVISILGPFPNVRNTLQGDASKMTKMNDCVTEWEIVMDSMIDGSGKEILAGTNDNIRRVKLHVHFADPSAILAVVPPESGCGVREDPLEDDGAHALLFVREDDLDAKLDMMRVS